MSVVDLLTRNPSILVAFLWQSLDFIKCLEGFSIGISFGKSLLLRFFLVHYTKPTIHTGGAHLNDFVCDLRQIQYFSSLFYFTTF